ncbi:MAG: ATPase, T2SS/T4P/T4SS family, partial [Anaerolineales bacterium]
MDNPEEDLEKKKAEAMRQMMSASPNSLGMPSAYVGLKNRVQSKLEARLAPARKQLPSHEAQNEAERLYDAILAEEGIVLSRAERQRLFDQIVNELFGLLGPLEPLLQDPAITEILVDGPDRVYVERKGKLEDVPIRFRDSDHLMEVIERIATPLGRRVDESHPMLDLRLPDGSRVNVITPPIALNGPALTIRKFWKTTLTAED